MQDGTPWPGNNTRDHPGMIQVKLNFCCQKLFDQQIDFPALSDYYSKHFRAKIVVILRFF